MPCERGDNLWGLPLIMIERIDELMQLMTREMASGGKETKMRVLHMKLHYNLS